MFLVVDKDKAARLIQVVRKPKETPRCFGKLGGAVIYQSSKL